MAEHNRLGIKGEQKAQLFLEELGFVILHTNWRYKHKEIDIVARNGDFIVFVEVKTRTLGGMQTAKESITLSKMRLLVEGADAYIEKFNCDEEARFDVLALTFDKGNWQIQHIKEAFNAMDI